MAQTVLTIAGYAIGSYFGYPQLGAIVGAYLGAQYETSQQEYKGPRLDDLKVPRLEYGQPTNRLWGRCRFVGQPLWMSAKREVASTSGGKGGGPEVTTYSYEVDVLYLVADNEIDAVTRIWANGELIYSTLAESDLTTLGASASTSRWTDITVYTGRGSSPPQMPDPIYEAAVGVGYAPAYRGRGTVMIQGLQLGNSGQVPMLLFEVLTSATSSPAWVPVAEGEPRLWEVVAQPVIPWTIGYGYTGAQADIVYSPLVAQHIVRTRNPVSNGKRYFEFFVSDASSSASEVGWLVVKDGSGNQYGSNYTGYYTSTGSNDGGPFPSVAAQAWDPGEDSVMMYAFDFVNGKYWVGRNGSWFGSVSGSDPATGVGGRSMTMTGQDLDIWLTIQPTHADFFSLLRTIRSSFTYSIPEGFVAWADEVEEIEVWTPHAIDLADVVRDLCIASGLDASQIDVSELVGTELEGVPVTSQATARATLEALAAAFYFECVESDKLYFRFRGGASVAALSSDDLCAGEDKPDDDSPVVLERGNDLEVPARWALAYINLDDNYQTGTVYSDRLLGESAATRTVQLPLVLTPSSAQGIVDTIALDSRVASTKLRFNASDIRPELEPTDVVTVADDEGITYRARLTSEQFADGVKRFEAVLDDSSVLRASGTSASFSPGITVAPSVRSEVLLSTPRLPLLRDADDGPGHYQAFKPASSGRWPGVELWASDDDVTYSLVGTVTRAAIGGYATTALGDWSGGNLFDERNSVTVSLGPGTLASTTRALMLSSSVNAMLIGQEVVQFRSATYVSEGVYTLRGLLRGRLGTEPYSTGHEANELVCLLENNGLLDVPLQVSQLNRLRYYRAVTRGTPVSSWAPAIYFDEGRRLKPYAPVDARVARDGSNNCSITWKRRSRLSSSFLAPGVYPPVGEDTEAYEVDVYFSGSPGVVVRTISASLPAAVYTAAQQTADGLTPGDPLELRIYQLSALVGRGFALQVDAA